MTICRAMVIEEIIPYDYKKYWNRHIDMLVFMIFAVTANSQDNFFEYDSENLIHSYFSSLKNGDTVQLLSMLAGPFRKERESLLKNNLQYAGFLRKINADLKYKILDMNNLDESKMAVEVLITRGEDIQRIKIILIKEDEFIKIYEEQVLP